MRTIKSIIIVVAAISGVLLPRLSKLYGDGNVRKCTDLVNTTIEILFFLFIPCGIGIIMIAPQIIHVLFGVSFEAGIVTLRIAALLIYALGLSNLFGTQILLSVGCEKELLKATVIGAITNICMNMILIPLSAQNGAAIASVISEALVTIYTYRQASRYIRININMKQTIIEIISSIIMGVVIAFIICWINGEIITLVLSVCVGIITYLLVNVLLRNPIIRLYNGRK